VLRAIWKLTVTQILKMINNVWPKDDKVCLFCSKPDYSDNAKALYEYMVQEESNNAKLLWIVTNYDVYKVLKAKNINAVRYPSWSWFYYLFRAKYIITTHNQFADIIAVSQRYINLWHGMPLKTMGFLENISSVEHEEYRQAKRASNISTFYIATSKLMKLALIGCFYADPRKVLIVGQPRNDYLFKSNGANSIKKVLGIDTKQYQKTIIYLPTFRKGSVRQDGSLNEMLFSDGNQEQLKKYLYKNNYLLMTKLHPLEQTIINTKNNRNIVKIESELLAKELVTLNEILNVADMLVTDYSSAYFDYLLLDKPILFISDDENEYAETRGFILDCPEFWRPGPKVTNIDEFITEASKLLNDPSYYHSERRLINNLVNLYIDDKAAKRVYKAIFQ